MDIASSSLVGDHVCDDHEALCTAHPSPAGSLESGRPPTASEAHLRTAATTFDTSGLRGKRQADSGQASGPFGRNPFGGFDSAAPSPSRGFGLFGGNGSAAPTPPLTGNILSGSKPASDTLSTCNASSTLGAGRVSKLSPAPYTS